MRTTRHGNFPDYATRCANGGTGPRCDPVADIVGGDNAIPSTAPDEYNEMSPMVLYRMRSCETPEWDREKGRT
ncbi:MAG: hypothetical protein OS112_03660 [Methanoregula sp.]|nr:MAG: hypothetical protein OS112_03660 [Methanoregula sp.]